MSRPRLRGAFDPRFQAAVGAVTTAAFLFVIWEVRRLAPLVHGETDLGIAPWAFLAGLVVGSVIGKYRLRALRKILPNVAGQFYISQGSALSGLPEGRTVLKLQKMAIATALVVWAAVAIYTVGSVMLLASWGAYLLGQLLAGQTFPCILLWLELRGSEGGASGGPSDVRGPRVGVPLGRASRVETERPRLRGAFDPRLQMAVGGAATAAALVVIRWFWRGDPSMGWAADQRIIPWALLAGLLVGSVIGKYRLRALRAVLPGINGRFFLTQAGVLSRLREGEIAVKSQRLAIGVSFLVWFGAATYSDGRLVLYGSWCAYVLGQLLAGQTFPFIRLWFELRKPERDAQAGS